MFLFGKKKSKPKADDDSVLPSRDNKASLAS